MTRLPKLLEQKEFEALLRDGDRIEAIAVAYADGRIDELPDRYFNYFLRLKTAFSILIQEPVKRRAIKKIEEALELTYPQVQKIVGDVQELFPRMELANREFDRLMMTEKLERLIDKIENGVETLVKKTDEFGDETGEEEMLRIGGDVNAPVLPRLYQLLSDIQGLKVKDAPLLPYDELKLPIPTFSTDINDMPGATGEETDYEEIPEDL